MPDKRIQNLWLLLFFADFCAIVTSYLLTLWLRFDSAFGGRLFDGLNSILGVRETGELAPQFELFYQAAGFRITCFLAIIICTVYALRDLYTERRFIIRQSVAADILVSNVIALFFIYAYFYLDRNVFHPRSIFALIIIINIFLTAWYRNLMERLLRLLRRRYGWDKWPVLLIGQGKSADLIEAHVRGHEPHGLYMAERLNIAPHEDIDATIEKARVAAVKHDIGMFIVVDNEMSVSQIMSFLEMSDKLDLPVKVLSDKLDVLVNRARIRIDVAFGGSLYHFASVSSAERFQWSKKLGSQVISGLGVLVTAPLFLAIALAIKVSSRGPVLYMQERIGKGGKPFRMIKFRTMNIDAEADLPEMLDLNESYGGLFKIRNDPRVTRVGRFLRRYSLDELPQLINVVKGDMTLVGPRPLPRSDYENFSEEWHNARHNGMPGLTCLWQISGRSDLDFHSMCILDVFYLRNQNWVMDLKIILRTFSVVLFAEGAY